MLLLLIQDTKIQLVAVSRDLYTLTGSRKITDWLRSNYMGVPLYTFSARTPGLC